MVWRNCTNPDRLTDRALRSLSLAHKLAQEANHDEISPEHMLLGLARGERGVARMMLEASGINLPECCGTIRLPASQPRKECQLVGLPLNSKTIHALGYAKEEAELLQHNYLGTEHLLLGLLRLEDCAARDFLDSVGIRIEQARECLKRILKEQ